MSYASLFVCITMKTGYIYGSPYILFHLRPSFLHQSLLLHTQPAGFQCGGYLKNDWFYRANYQAPTWDEVQTQFQYPSDKCDIYRILSLKVYQWQQHIYIRTWQEPWKRIKLCADLCPLICLRVVSFNDTKIHLSVITAHGKQTVSKETNTNCIPADAHWGHSCPHICLRVIPADRQGKEWELTCFAYWHPSSGFIGYILCVFVIEHAETYLSTQSLNRDESDEAGASCPPMA